MKPSDLPTSLAIEQRVLACEIDRGTEALLTIIENGITPATFADPFCRRIHETVLGLHATGLPFALQDILECMKPSFTEASSLMDITRSPDESMIVLPRLCSELRALECRRRTMVLTAKLSMAAKDEPEQMSGIIAELLATQADTAKAISWSKICDAAAARALDAINGKTNTAAMLSWGWPELDQRFETMGKGELVIIAARPSVGKSSLARAVASTAAIGGRRVLFESLEVPADQMVNGMATSLSGHSFKELRDLLPVHQQRFLQSIATLREAPMQVHQDRTMAGIIARTKATHAQAPLDVLVIDYLGLIADCEPAKGQTKAQAVGTVTKALKRLAMELQIVVICLSQINRQSVNEGNREPRLSDLRDSGDIEQDADRVCFIHMPDECPFTKQPQSQLDDVSERPRFGCALIQAKGRNSGTGYGAVWFHRRLARFEFE